MCAYYCAHHDDRHSPQASNCGPKQGSSGGDPLTFRHCMLCRGSRQFGAPHWRAVGWAHQRLRRRCGRQSSRCVSPLAPVLRCRKGTHWPPQCARNRSIRPSRRPCQAVSVGERSTQHGRYDSESCRHTHLLRPSRKIESVRLLRPTHSPSARARCACRLSPVRVACRDDGDDRRAERRVRSPPTSLSAYVGRCASCDVARSCDLCIAKLRCMGLPRWRVLADRCLPVCVDACGQEPDGWCGKRSWERERGESGPVPSRALTPAPRPARCRLWSGGRRRTPDRQAALVLGLGLDVRRKLDLPRGRSRPGSTAYRGEDDEGRCRCCCAFGWNGTACIFVIFVSFVRAAAGSAG